jgi:multidrug efflux pump subunit AcrA (membrane-fusion protein)/YHS domain-containing protein
VAVAAFLAGSWWNRGAGGRPDAAGGRRILYYHDPMHPAYKSDKPGIAPDCGMQLEPVYADGVDAAPDASLPPGLVHVGADKQQLIGMRLEAVQQGDAEHRFRVLGRVAADEARTYRLNAPSDGVVREISAVTSGATVKAGQILATFFTRDSLTLRDQQSFLGTINGQAAPQYAGNVENFRDLLRLGGMTEDQMAEVEKTHKTSSTFRIVAPVAGIVLARNLSPGQRFEKGTEFYRIADLTSVWVLADVFENEARLLDAASAPTVRYQGRTFPAKRSESTPQFDPNTRALKVRLDVANPAGTLRPDMFVDVDFDLKVRNAITVPVDAVLDSGLRKSVFVEHGEGYFEPRSVETGVRLGDRIVVTSGLMPGDRIVVSGNFLIDSESRFQLAGRGPVAPAADGKDPVCGMAVDAAKTEHKAQFGGKTYYFCSESCKSKFTAHPASYVDARGSK